MIPGSTIDIYVLRVSRSQLSLVQPHTRHSRPSEVLYTVPQLTVPRVQTVPGAFVRVHLACGLHELDGDHELPRQFGGGMSH